MRAINHLRNNKNNNNKKTDHSGLVFFFEKINAHFKDAVKFNCQEIIISTSKKVGEGEHKIYSYIRENSEYHHNTCTAIYGLDSDLIMLTLNHLKFAPSMYLFRETPFFIKNLDNTLEPNSHYLLDIPEFADKLADNLADNLAKKQIKQETKHKLIADYVKSKNKNVIR